MKKSAQDFNNNQSTLESSSEYVKIGEAAKILGVSERTLRYWESKGLISPTKTPAGTRLYEVESLKGVLDHKELTAGKIKAESLNTSLPEGNDSSEIRPRNLALEMSEVKLDSNGNKDNSHFSFIEPVVSSDSKPANAAGLAIYSFAVLFLVGILSFFGLNISYLLNTDQTVSAVASVLGNKANNQTTESRNDLLNNNGAIITVFKGLNRASVATVSLISPKKGSEIKQALAEKTNDRTLASSQKLNSKLASVLAATANAQILFVNTDTNIAGSLNVESLQASDSGSFGGALSVGTTAGFGGTITAPSAVFNGATNQLQLGGNITINGVGPTSAFIAEFPVISGTDTFVFENATQTLTNKTISGSSNTFTNIPNSALSNGNITITAGTGMSGGGTVSLGGSVTLNNAGVTSLTGGTDITVSSSTGSVTVDNISTLSSVTGRGASTSTALNLLGNVGIGTTASSNTPLVVSAGGIQIYTGAPSSTTDVLYQTSDTLFWNGNSVAIGGSISGTTNQIAYFTSSDSVGSSVMSQSGSNIGIGSTNPGGKLSVYGGLGVGTSYFTTAPPGNGAIFQGNVGIGTNNPNTAALAVIGGNVGIGTTTPSEAVLGISRTFSSSSNANYSGVSVDITDTYGDGGLDMGKYGGKFDLTMSGAFTDTDFGNPDIRGVYGNVTFTGDVSNNTTVYLYGGDFAVSAGGTNTAADTVNAYGIQTESAGDLGTTGNTSHYGISINSAGTADNNYGLMVSSVASATNNYGVYIDSPSASANNFALYSNSAAQSYFAGNVGLGTSTPVQRLDVRGTGAFSGNVSIGTTSVSTYGLQVQGTTGLVGNLALIRNVAYTWPAANAAGNNYVLTSQTDGTLAWTSSSALASRWDLIASPAGNQSLTMGTYTTSWNWATGTSTNNLFNITSDNSADGTGYLVNIATGTSSTVKPLRIMAGSTQALSIDAAGNVGIGTTGPGNQLELYQNGSEVTPQLLVHRLGAGDASIGFFTDPATGWSLGIDNSDVDKFKIGTNYTDVGAAPLFTIDQGGNVGIGTVSPNVAKLQLAAGNIGVDSTYGLDTNSSTGTLYIGRTNAGVVTVGNNTSATALNFTSGTGSQTHTSSVATGTTTSGAFVFNASSLSSGTGLYVTSTATSGRLVDINASNTSGTIFNLAYGASKTLDGDTTGFFVDLNSGNVVATNQNLTGVNFKIPTVTNTQTSTTKTLTGMLVNFGSGAGINQNGAGGTLEYVAGDLYLPALTQTAGTLNAYGIRITTPATITTGGTAYGSYISASGVGAGTLYGVSVSDITGQAGTEYAYNVAGTGWDAVLRVGSTTVINGSGVTQVAGGGTGIASYTAGDLIYASDTTTLSKLAGGVANNGKVLTVTAGLPVWGVISGSSCTDCVLSDPTSTTTNTIAPTGDNTTGLIVKQTSTALGGNTPDIFSICASANCTGANKYFYVDYLGNVSTGSISNTNLTLTPTTNSTALTLVGTNVTSAKNQYINTKNTSGTIFDLSYGASATLASAIVGANIDLSTNVTANNVGVSGEVITLPAATNTATSANYAGLTVTGGALNQVTSGTLNYYGTKITVPAITQSGGTLNAYGTHITTPSSITTGGTASGVYVNASGVGAGTLYGVNISDISSAGDGAEYGLSIGSGWDTNLLFNDTTTIVKIANGGTITVKDTGDNNLCTITDNGSVGDFSCTGTISGAGQVGFWSQNNNDIYPSTITNNVGIGTTAPTALFHVGGSSTTDGSPFVTAQISAVQTTANSSSFYGLNLAPSYSAASGNTLGTLYSAAIIPNNSSTGTISTVYGAFIRTDNSSTGTITDAYNIYIANPTNNGTISNRYAFVSQANAGNVGIGTTTPIHKLGVIGTGYFSGNVSIGTTTGGNLLRLFSSDTNNRGQGIIYSAADATGGLLSFVKARASLTTVQTGDQLGAMVFGGYDSDNAPINAASIGGYVNGTVASGSVPTDLVFTTGSSAAGTEKMRIESGGNVAIGTTTGRSKIFLNYAINTSSSWWLDGDAGMTIQNTDGSGDAILKLGGSSAIQRIVYGGGTASDKLVFSSRNATSTLGSQVAFTNTGNVGIGTSNPVQKLDVSGIGAFTGNVGIGTTLPSLVSSSSVYGTALSLLTTDAAKRSLIELGNNSASIADDVIFGQLSFVMSAGSTSAPSAAIAGLSEGTSENSAHMLFYTMNAGTLAEQMRIDNNGNVGIGTASTPNKLNLATDQTAMLLGSIANNGSDYGGILAFGQNSGTGTLAGSIKLSQSATDIYRMHFDLYGAGGASSTRMVIDGNGNVGIGTTTPANLLVVASTSGTDNLNLVRFKGNLDANGEYEYLSVGSGDYAKFGFIYDSATANTGAFISGGSDRTPTNGLVVKYGGNVGLGTTVPAQKLDVRGTGYFANNVGIGTSTVTGAALSVFGSGTGIAIGTTSTGGYDLRVTGQTFLVGNVDFGFSDVSINRNGTTGSMILSATNNVGIGTTNPNSKLFVQGRIGQSTWTADGDTAVYYDVTTNGFGTQASDVRLKKNLSVIENPLSIINQVTGYKYNMLDEADGTKRRLGVLAQDLLGILPEATFQFTNEGSSETYYSVHYEKLTALLIEGVKELDSKSAAKYKLNSQGVLEIPELKVGKLVLDESLDTSGTANYNGTLSFQLTGLEQRLGDIETNTETSQNTLAATVNGLSAEVAGVSMTANNLSSELLSTQGNVATTSAELASAKFDISQIQQDIEELKLAPPEVLESTGSGTFANVDVFEKISTLDIQATGIATFSGVFKALGDSFLGDTTLAGDLSQDGTLSISSGSSINVTGLEGNGGVLYLQNNALAQGVDVFNGKVTISKEGKLSIERLALGGDVLGVANVTTGLTSIEVTSAKLTDKSKIFTSVSKPVAVGVKDIDISNNKFTIEMQSAQSEDVAVNWWIVDSR